MNKTPTHADRAFSDFCCVNRHKMWPDSLIMYCSSNRVIEAFTSLLSGLTLWFFIVASLAAFFLPEITSDELPAIIGWCHYRLRKVVDLLDRSCIALDNFDRWFNRINTPPDLKDNPFSATVQVFYTWCM